MIHFVDVTSLPSLCYRVASFVARMRVASRQNCDPCRSSWNFDLVHLVLFLRQISRIHLLDTQTMRLTIATEEGATFNVDVDSSMELNDFAALLEAEASHPRSQQRA